MKWWTGVMFGVVACGNGETSKHADPLPVPKAVAGAAIDELELPHYRALAPTGWMHGVHPDAKTYRLNATDPSFAISIEELDGAPDELRDGASDARCVDYAKRLGATRAMAPRGTSHAADFGALVGCELELANAQRTTHELVLFANPDHGVRIACLHDNGPAPAVDEACVALAWSIIPRDFPGRLVRTIDRADARLTVPRGWVLVTDPTMTSPGVDTLMRVPHDGALHPMIKVKDLPLPPDALARWKVATVDTCAMFQRSLVTATIAAGAVKVWDQHGFHGCEIETIANDPDEEATRDLVITDGTSAITIACVRAKLGDAATDAACTALAGSATAK